MLVKDKNRYRFGVYIVYAPSEPFEGRYVGCGTKERPRDHLKRQWGRPNREFAAWLENCKAANIEVAWRWLREPTTSKIIALITECSEVARIGIAPHGPLFNHPSGLLGGYAAYAGQIARLKAEQKHAG